jgi:uncharacterized alkaline shock family protein YloU
MSEIREYISATDESGSVNISEDVLSVIVAAAASETEGVHALYPSYGREISELLNKKALNRSVRVNIGDGTLTVDVYIVAELGASVNKVGLQVQTAVRTAIEGACAITPNAVNVHVCGVSLKKKA